MAHGMHSICQLFATRVLFPSSGACKDVVVPHYLRAIGGDAAYTPSVLAYVLAAVPGGCAHTAREFIELLPHVHPIDVLTFLLGR